MKNKSRRFEVLLPARFNDGRDVPDELLGKAIHELIAQFQAVSFYKEAAEGYWQHDDKVYCDSLGLLVVDVPDTAANRKWMKAYKARWKEQLDQLEMLDGQLPDRYRMTSRNATISSPLVDKFI